MVNKTDRRQSTLELCGHGQFTLVNGIGGEARVDAAGGASKALGLPMRTQVIGLSRAVEGHHGDWAQAREVGDAGCLSVRPDHHVAWHTFGMTSDA